MHTGGIIPSGRAGGLDATMSVKHIGATEIVH